MKTVDGFAVRRLTTNFIGLRDRLEVVISLCRGLKVLALSKSGFS